MRPSRDDRRIFLQQLAAATAGVVLMPVVSACSTKQKTGPLSSIEIPTLKPANWDPIAYNKMRGNAGAIPDFYLDDINGPEGDNKHLGKHLPFFPSVEAAMVPAGFIALMWGDPEKGHAKHPNAPAKKDNDFVGHWYNWIRVQKADAEELQSDYPTWPSISSSEGGYAVYGGGSITDDNGKNTIYLAALPQGAKIGDTLRIHAHCLTHGEYVDFITI